jgi:hypothetical protein
MTLWWPSQPLITLILLVSLLVIPVRQSRAQDVYPPLDSPKLRFENSGVRDQRAPSLPGLDSPWRVAQWAKSQALNPNDLRRHDDLLRDPMLGGPELSDATPDGQSTVLIYRTSAGYVFELRSQNGVRQAGGSSNLFLTASPITQDVTFDNIINYDVDAKLSEATASYNTPYARANADVLAHVFTGFTLNMHGVVGSPNYDIFLQIGHSGTREEPSGFFSCQVGKLGSTVSVGFGANRRDAQWLDYKSDRGTLHHLHYTINDYLQDMLARIPSCQSVDGAKISIPFSDAAHNLRNWKLGGIYLGLETHNRDVRPTATNHDAQGGITVALQIANLHVRQVAGPPAKNR